MYQRLDCIKDYIRHQRDPRDSNVLIEHARR